MTSKEKYNERMARARSGRMTILPTVTSKTAEMSTLPLYESGPKVITTGDVESGDVGREVDITEVDVQVTDASHKCVGRGPCNRFERGLCKLGIQFGVLVVFE